MTQSPTLRSNGLNVRKWFTRHRLGGAALLCLVLIAGCGPAPLGTGWPAISLIDSACGDTTTQSIMVAFNDRIVKVNPVDGKPQVLLNADCEPRPPEQNGQARVWDFRGPGPNMFFSTPTLIDDDTLLAAAYNQHIFTIDMVTARADDADGVPIQETAGHTVAQLVPSPDGELFYLGLGAKDLVALDSNDFTITWTIPTQQGVWSKPVVVDNTIYFTSLDHNLYAADAKTGEVRWTLDLEGAAASTPLYDGEYLYVGSFARKIFKINLDGQVVNQYTTQDWVWGTPAVVDDILYSADLAGNVYALDAGDLSEIWRQKVAGRAIRGTPLVTDERIVVAARDQKVYWLNRDDGTPVIDAEGQPLVRELRAEILSDVLLVEPGESLNIPEPYIVVGTLSTSDILVAYTLERGQYVWTYSFS
jgi:outer membrane protein assembly factor BamB